MGVIHYCGESLGGAYCIEPAVHRNQGAHHGEHLHRVTAQIDCRSVNRQQVACVELAYELEEHLASVYLKQHPVKSRLQQTALEIAHAAQGVCGNLGLGVLCHDQTVLIVQIGNHKGILGHIVKELFLGLEIVLDRLMVIQMVTSQVGEYSAGILQAADALLYDGV